MADFEQIVKQYVTDNGAIPETAINALVTAIKTVNGNEYVEKERYKAKLSEIDALKEQQQTAEDSVATAEKWKTKYEGIKSEFENFKSEQRTKEERTSKSNAYRGLLKQAGVSEKRIDAILKVTDVDGLKLGADGNIENSGELLEGIKTEWADFIPAENAGQKVDTGGSLQGAKGTLSVDEIMAIEDDAERQNAIAENHELFGI